MILLLCIAHNHNKILETKMLYTKMTENLVVNNIIVFCVSNLYISCTVTTSCSGHSSVTNIDSLYFI